MALDARIAKAFGLQGDAWQRHASPWSVNTRLPIPPLLVGAIWSRRWLGWGSLIPVSLVRVDRRQPAGVPSAALPGPLGFPGRAGRDLLGQTARGRRSAPAPGRTERPRGAQRARRPVHRARTRRAERVDGLVRAGRADGREDLVHRPHGAAL